MPPHALLEAATDLVHRVLRFEHPADRVVADFFRESRSLGSRERHTLTDTVFAVLRELPLLRHLARAGSGEQERRLVLLAWTGNAGFLRAALSESEVAWLERSRATPREALPEPLRHNLPEWFAERMQAQLGEEFWPWVEAIGRPAPLDLRVNVAKASRDEALARLRAGGIAAEATPYSPVGIRVEGKPSLNKLEIYTEGWIEVQDEGSQLLALLTGAKRGEMVVDFCAGAGGKTLALGAQMRNTGRLYAFDVSGHRLAALKPRLARSSLSNVYPVQIAHERDERIKRLGGKVDRVLVDAPCTGLGTLRRHPDLKWRQTPEALAALGELQRKILDAAARLLKPGGRLVYATCSPLREEDEQVADDFDAGTLGGSFTRLPALELLQRAQVSGSDRLVSGSDLRLWTHRHGSDGFYAAAWERRAS
ncbi:MAG: RsmB/NOP family class I SAM-dependent RNA methyltransferase [Burkholderiales bacterium]|nr:RsmB/NOP family class I SAM-dependent RNA methyltransferase [Burkholderiales bacterium]